MPTTINFGWSLPTDGGSTDTWGDILNTQTLAGVDTTMKSVSDVASAALPKSGGTMTGKVDLTVATTPITDMGSVSGTVTLNCSLGHVFYVRCTGAVALVLDNVPAGVALGILVKIINGTVGFTHPAGTVWAAGAAPTLSAGTDWVGYILTQSGTAPVGVAVALAVA